MSTLMAYVSASDLQVLERVLAAHPPRWLRFAVLWATRLGDGWLWLGIGLLLLALGGRCHTVCAAAAIAAGIANVAQVLLKRRFRRPRPCAFVRHPLYDVRPLGHFPSDRFSFPSGHALNAFAIGTVLALQYPLLAPAITVVAAGVGVSRVLLGLHYLSDVLAGSLIGAVIGAEVFHVLLG